MILNRGNMWSVFGQYDVFVFTANSYIRNDGALVMGRGIAKVVRDRFRGLDLRIGKWIDRQVGHLGAYGFVTAVIRDMNVTHRIGVFQVKRNFADSAELGLIKASVTSLDSWIRIHRPKRIDMNFPGIGNGKLKRADVLTLIETLPDCVHIWER